MGLGLRILSAVTSWGHSFDGTAETFEQARAEFEAAWTRYLPQCSDTDFAEHRHHRAYVAWKYRMWDTHHKLPTQMTSGRSKCFCGVAITATTIPDHVRQDHLDTEAA